MTGEMHYSEVTRDEYPWHFAIADALGGTVEPFDHYQGPYVRVDGCRVWICSDDGEAGTVFAEPNVWEGSTRELGCAESEPFPLYPVSLGAAIAADLARVILL